ncbi:MAG: hypothetical protein RLZZ505_2173 [Verrucomicrobiota bacterium]|jgi:hypothetical protein
MKLLAAILLAFTSLTTLSSAHFLWATKEYWLNSFEGCKITKLPKIASNGAELIAIDPVKGSEDTDIPYKLVIVIIGDRVMSYTAKRKDNQPMTEKDILFCLNGCADVETKFSKPVQDGDFMTWMRTDEKVIVRYDRVTNTAIMADFAYFIFDGRTMDVSKMEADGLGATWRKQLNKKE